jgi:hypothetical protein
VAGPVRDWNFRFGIELDGGRSRFYRVRSAARLPQLYVERGGLDKYVHMSLHKSGQWHLKVKHRHRHQMVATGGDSPRFTRAVLIVQPAAVATVDQSETPADAVLIPMNAGEDLPVHFDVYLERPGANLASWPGKNAMNTVLVGRGPLADGAGTCCVVALHGDVESGPVTLPAPEPNEVERMRADIARGDRYMTLFAPQADGAMGLIDGRVELNVTEAEAP